MTSLQRSLVLGLKTLLAILLSFVFLEFMLLVLNDVVFRKSIYVYDPDLGFRVRPHAQWGDNVTNEFGFNDRDYAHQREPGTYRILFLGDSYGWAGGLEGNYTALLERRFEAEFGDSRVEVINAGYDATHTGEQLEALRKFGLRYHPDLVVLAFFVGNDFIDAVPWRRRINVGGSQVDIDTRTDREMTFLGQLVLPLQSRLYLFLRERWATYRYLRTRHRAETQPTARPTTDPPDSSADQAESGIARAQAQCMFRYTEANVADHYLDLERYRIQIFDKALRDSGAAADLELREDFVFASLLAMRDLLREERIQFMIVAYPDNFQVEESLRQVLFDHYDLHPARFQLDRPQRLLRSFCEEHQIAFHDLLPTLRAKQQEGERLYLINDSHWNETGIRVAAEYLFEALMPKAQEYFARR